MFRAACLFLAVLLVVVPARAQKFDPPKVAPPTDAELKQIADKIAELEKAIDGLKPKLIDDLLKNPGLRVSPDSAPGMIAISPLPDLEIFVNAARLIVRHKEFYHKDSVKWTLEILDKGVARAKAIAADDYSWQQTPGKTVVRGYRSWVDGSAQPYAVSFPANFKPDRKWRTDVVLHGRDSSFSEVKFLRSHGERKVGEASFVQIDIAGRGNNAYRWAGEQDVLEAVLQYKHENFKAVDDHRIVLRGFSMGGAGTWHLGLHHPYRWCVIGPGAGFTTTHGYIGGLPETLPPYQEACLKIYDAIDYAENAAMVPIVAYSGGKDPQKRAADNIEERLKSLNLSMTHLIAPDEEHRFPPEWFKKADILWSKHAEAGRAEYPEEVHFTTYTLRYPYCEWLSILGLGKHYEKARVDAKRTKDGFEATTRNVTLLSFKLPKMEFAKQTVTIDGQKLTTANGYSSYSELYLVRKGVRWQLAENFGHDGIEYSNGKRPELQGPIDDAFMEGFLCVRGTGKPWHANVKKYTDADLDRFEAEWSKYFRGKLRIKNDADVDDKDIRHRHLILFGDPSSNSLIAKVLKDLPIRWNETEVTVGSQTAASANHVPVLIHPNPLNRNRYVVLNSGHTFHAKEFQGTNAQLYPRLGDYALLRIPDGGGLNADVVTAGLFDEMWRFPK